MTTPQKRANGGPSYATPVGSKTTPRKAEQLDWDAFDASDGTGFTCSFPNPKYLAEAAKKGKKNRTQKIVEQNHKSKFCTLDQNDNPIQLNPFPGSSLPDVHYQVEPAEYWWSAPVYRKFTVENETFSVGDYVHIRPDEGQDHDRNATIQDWVGKVLEVRAADGAHVYVRIYWMYRPEDLPGGRQPYHGKNELIASNSMDIISAQAVNEKADVVHWVEKQDQNELLDPDYLFWRQTLDVITYTRETKTKNKGPKVSSLPNHCIDDAPCNPDDILIQCSHCSIWLHGSCIEEQAIRDAYRSYGLVHPGDDDEEDTDALSKRTNSNKRKRSSAKRSASKKASHHKAGVRAISSLLFTAEVVASPNSKTKLIIKDQRLGHNNKTWEAPLKCLKCHHDVESNAENEDAAPGNIILQNELVDRSVETPLSTSSSPLFVRGDPDQYRSVDYADYDTTEESSEVNFWHVN